MAKTYVLVEHQVTGRIAVGVYDHKRRELTADGAPARLADYWAVCELARVPREQKRAQAEK